MRYDLRNAISARRFMRYDLRNAISARRLFMQCDLRKAIFPFLVLVFMSFAMHY